MLPKFDADEKQILEQLFEKMVLPNGKTLKDDLVEVVGFRLMGTILANGNTFSEEVHEIDRADYVKEFKPDGQSLAIRVACTKFDTLVEKLQEIFPPPAPPPTLEIVE